MKWSIVIPAFREESRLPGTMKRVLAYLDSSPAQAEVIVVDDGSPDGTAAVANGIAAADARVRVISLPQNRGKGAAVRAGVLAAQGERILYCDADLSTPIEEIGKLDAALDAGADVAVGSRAAPGADVQIRQGVARVVMGRVFRALVRLLTVRGIKDTQCGFKLFSRRAARLAFENMTIDRFGFDVEVLYLVVAAGLKVDELPVVWRNDDRSTVSPVRDSARMFMDLWRIRWRHQGRRLALPAVEYAPAPSPRRRSPRVSSLVPASANSDA